MCTGSIDIEHQLLGCVEAVVCEIVNTYLEERKELFSIP